MCAAASVRSVPVGRAPRLCVLIRVTSEAVCVNRVQCWIYIVDFDCLYSGQGVSI